MPKQYRGGKGRNEKPLTNDEKEFVEVGRTPSGIVVIQVKSGIDNTVLPMYSNSPDTTYFALSKDGTKQHAIGIYKDHQLVQSIDFDDVRGNYFHTWGNPKIVRGKMTLIRGAKDIST